jgi:hypothetical protein
MSSAETSELIMLPRVLPQAHREVSGIVRVETTTLHDVMFASSVRPPDPEDPAVEEEVEVDVAEVVDEVETEAPAEVCELMSLTYIGGRGAPRGGGARGGFSSFAGTKTTFE